MADFLTENARTTPVSHECDVFVAGGGIAGTAAALAAARAGASVVLAEREFLPGGLATLGLVTIYLPLDDGTGRQVMFGITNELFTLSLGSEPGVALPEVWLEPGHTRGERTEHRLQVQFNPHSFALDCEKLLCDSGVKLLYGTHVCSALTEHGRISAAVCEGKAGRFAVRAHSFVDATGDADLCATAGAPTLLYSAGNVTSNWYYGRTDSHSAFLKMHSLPYTGRANSRFGGIEDQTDFVLASHEFLRGGLNAERSRDGSFAPTSVPSIPTLRMTRRLAGLCTPDEAEQHLRREDSIGMCGDWRKRGPLFELPFGSLICGELTNLYCAGRCISVTDAMWDITRVIPPCALTGEAAGTAAALRCGSGDVARLQSALRANGNILHEADLD